MDKEENRAPTPLPAEGGNCAAGDDMTAGLPLAMAYVPKQEWREMYDCSEALAVGTLFRELNLPFEGVQMGGTE